MTFFQSVANRYRVVASDGLAKVEESAKKMLGRFFVNEKLPIPNFKIVNDRAPHWLGRTVYHPAVDETNTTIQIQKKIIGDDKTLDRVMAHELIHHLEFLRKGKTLTHPIIRKLHDGHGDFFHAWARRINSEMGEDFVNESSDMSYVLETDSRPFFVVLRKIHGKLGWSWFVRPSASQKEELQRLMAEGETKVIRSTDAVFMDGVKFKKWGGISVPNANEKEFIQKITDLYEHEQSEKVA